MEQSILIHQTFLFHLKEGLAWYDKVVYGPVNEFVCSAFAMLVDVA